MKKTPPEDSTRQARIAKVALNLPFFKALDYRIPSSIGPELRIGQRVLVPFGPRRMIGVVTDLAMTSKVKGLKPIDQIIDPEVLYDPWMLDFCQWSAGYYLCGLGEILQAALPGGLKPKLVQKVEIDPEFKQEQPQWAALMQQSIAYIKQEAKKNKELAKAIREKKISFPYEAKLKPTPLIQTRFFLTKEANPYQPRKNSKAEKLLSLLAKNPMSRDEINQANPDVSTVLSDLIKRGIVLGQDEKIDSCPNPLIHDQAFLPLNQEQAEALAPINEAIEKSKFTCFLLKGVTGSGKTEVYLHAVKTALEKKLGVLVLIPEISLTPQTVERFSERFGERIAVLHSRMTQNERARAWWRIKSAQADLVIGARSAIFAPLPKLGLIIVDEEHDSSYKQQEAPFYHARDLAVYLGSLRKATVVLGTATPSIESFQNAKNGKYRMLKLNQRIHQQNMPKLEILDLKDQSRQKGAFYLSKALLTEIEECLKNQNQVLLFLNRRGFSAFLSCRSCQIPLLCRNCSIPMAWHKKDRLLRCHHCGFQSPEPLFCPECKAKEGFKLEGVGTQRVEQDFKALFPKARVLRMDRDSLSAKDSLQKSIDLINQAKVDLIIGTQLISKGHDFKRIALVCVILADLSLNIPDFRSSERSFQILSQVSGRAGRGEKGGGFSLIQTYNPEHHAIQTAIRHDFEEFFEREIELRRILGNPPWQRMILIKLSHPDQFKAKKEAQSLFQLLNQGFKGLSLSLMGPVDAPIHKVNNRYYQHIQIKALDLGRVKQSLWELVAQPKGGLRLLSGTRLSVDVDPYHLM